MKYLRFSADYIEPSVIDQAQGSTRVGNLGLSVDLQRRIEEWNERYQAIIPLDMQARSTAEACSSIASLDVEGLSLARGIEDEVPDGAKVEYYSEGLWKRIAR